MKQYAALDDTVYFWFAANDTSGSGGDGASPAADVRLAGAAADAAPVYSPTPTLLSHANYPAGAYEIAITATAANGFASNNTYAIFCTLAIDAQNPTGFVGSFDLKPVKANVTQLLDTAWLTPGVAGTPDVNAKLLGGTAQTGNDVGADVNSILEDTGTTLDALIKDVPTVAEFEARSILAADYVVVGDTIAGVTAVTNDVGITQAGADKVWGTAARALTDKVGFGLSTAGILAIWHQLTANIVTADTIGKLLKDDINATISSRSSHSANDARDAILDDATRFSGADLASILTDTAEIGTAGAGLTDLGGMATGMKAEIESECNDALVVLKLDHLVAVADGDDPVNNSIIALLAASDGDWSGFDKATEALEAIRDRGDAAWVTGAGGSDRLLMVDTTIATLASQTSFTLTAGSADDDAYNNCTIVIEDSASATQKAVGIISNYVGASKTVTLKYDPSIFTIATTDKVYILAENALKATLANRQLNVAADGDIAGNVDGSVASVVGHTVQTGDSYAIVNHGTYGNSVIEALVDELESRLTAVRAGYLDNINNANLATIADISTFTATEIAYLNASISSRSSHTAANVWAVGTRALTDKAGFSLATAGITAIWEKNISAFAGAGYAGTYVKTLYDDWINAGRLDAILDIIAADVVNLDGDAMRGTDSANTTTPPTVNAIADQVWDEILTAATHNIATSAGRRLRETAAYAISHGTAQAGAATTITLAADADGCNGIYNRNLIVIVGGTGAGQTRTIADYNNTTKVCIIDREWRINPDATSEYQILADDTPLVVDQGVAQAGTATTITLRGYASSINDTYLCNIIAIIGGTGRGQARLVGSYNGSTKVITLCGDNWVTNPDNTSVYVMIPYGTTCTSCIGTHALSQINAECDTALADFGKTGYALSAAGVDAILDEVVEGTTTFRQMLRIFMAALAGKSAGGGTVTITFRDVADGKNRISATVDADGNRTAITLDGT